MVVFEVAVGGLEDDAFAEEEAEFTGEGLAAVKIVIVGGGEDAAAVVDRLVEGIDMANDNIGAVAGENKGEASISRGAKAVAIEIGEG